MENNNNKKPLNSRPLTAADLGIGKAETPRSKPAGTRPNADPITGNSKGFKVSNNASRPQRPAGPRPSTNMQNSRTNQPSSGQNQAQNGQSLPSSIGGQRPNSHGGNNSNNNRNKNSQNRSDNRGPNNRGGNNKNQGGGRGRSTNPHAMRRRYDRGPAVFSEGSFNENSSKTSTVPAIKPVGVSKADAGKLKIIPLGGLDKIGKNMMALEYEDDIIVMDLGFMFPGPETPGIDYIIPDTNYLEERKHKIRAHLITHAHMDHVGGIPFILPKLPAPIYAAQFSIKFIERQLEEYKLPFKPDLRTIDQDSGQKIQLGAFSVEFIRITHSIPDACSIAIKTPVGTIINTGDWRFDDDPLSGKPSNKTRLKELGDEGVMLLMCDSTSCENIGTSPSEKKIIETLDEIFVRNYNKRVIISSFASQVDRIQVFIDAAAKAKRKLAPIGRSLIINM